MKSLTLRSASDHSLYFELNNFQSLDINRDSWHQHQSHLLFNIKVLCTVAVLSKLTSASVDVDVFVLLLVLALRISCLVGRVLKAISTTTWVTKYSQVLKINIIYDTRHPSWMGQSTILATWEVVYYILSGTPRSLQKCFWPHLRVEFSGENHLLLICGKIPNQTVWITKNLDSWLNSDLFKKKVCPNRTCLDSFR